MTACRTAQGCLKIALAFGVRDAFDLRLAVGHRQQSPNTAGHSIFRHRRIGQPAQLFQGSLPVFDAQLTGRRQMIRHTLTQDLQGTLNPGAAATGRDGQNKLGKIVTRKFPPVAIASGVPPDKMAARSKLPEATSLEPAIAVMRLPKLSAMSALPRKLSLVPPAKAEPSPISVAKSPLPN